MDIWSMDFKQTNSTSMDHSVWLYRCTASYYWHHHTCAITVKIPVITGFDAGGNTINKSIIVGLSRSMFSVELT